MPGAKRCRWLTKGIVSLCAALDPRRHRQVPHKMIVGDTETRDGIIPLVAFVMQNKDEWGAEGGEYSKCRETARIVKGKGRHSPCPLRHILQTKESETAQWYS